MRILIIKTSSMGDVVHALPAVSDIVAQVPGAVVDWMVEAPFAAISQMHRGVNQVHVLRWRKWRKHLLQRSTWDAMGEFRAQLRAQPYDKVIDLQGLVKSALWGRQALGPMVGYDRHSLREPLAARFYLAHAPVSRALPAVTRCRQLVAHHLGYAVPQSQPDFGLSAPPLVDWQALVSCQGSNAACSLALKPDGVVASRRHSPSYDSSSRLASGLDGGAIKRHLSPDTTLASAYAVLIPGASRPEKLWPQDRWHAIAQKLSVRGWTPVVLWGSPAEEGMAQEIAAASGGLVPPFLTVSQAASVLAGAKVVVGLDTGFSHLAAALGRPTLGIYCDHEPGLAGITGPAWVRSIGGKGQVPGLASVSELVDEQMMQAELSKD